MTQHRLEDLTIKAVADFEVGDQFQYEPGHWHEVTAAPRVDLGWAFVGIRDRELVMSPDHTFIVDPKKAP